MTQAPPLGWQQLDSYSLGIKHIVEDKGAWLCCSPFRFVSWTWARPSSSWVKVCWP